MHHVCGLCFCLCFVCVPPFSKEGGDVVCEKCGFMDCIVVAMSWNHVFLLLLGVCVCVSGCGCLTLSAPGVAGARAGCPEAPVTCEVAKGEEGEMTNE